MRTTTKKPILIISFLGFETQEILGTSNAPFLIVLKLDTATLNEVVLIGYGEKKRRNLTTAISTVNYEILKDQDITSFDQALAGQIPGVQIMQTSGAPGGNISIQIRGTGLSGTQPLFVIDGVPLDNDLHGATGTITAEEQHTNPLSTINPEDIESISVLKDAAAAAIYGSRGSSGVIIITTKSGRGEMKVSYKGSIGVQMVLKKIDVLDAYQYAQFQMDGQNERYMNNNSNGDPNRAITDPNGIRNISLVAPEFYPYVNGIQGLTNTDWQDEIFRLAKMNKHNISISGGSDASNYYVSGNFLDQEGTVINSAFKRYSLRLKYNVKHKNVKFGINVAPSYTDYDKVAVIGSSDYNHFWILSRHIRLDTKTFKAG